MLRDYYSRNRWWQAQLYRFLLFAYFFSVFHSFAGIKNRELDYFFNLHGRLHTNVLMRMVDEWRQQLLHRRMHSLAIGNDYIGSFSSHRDLRIHKNNNNIILFFFYWVWVLLSLRLRLHLRDHCTQKQNKKLETETKQKWKPKKTNRRKNTICNVWRGEMNRMKNTKHWHAVFGGIFSRYTRTQMWMIRWQAIANKTQIWYSLDTTHTATSNSMFCVRVCLCGCEWLSERSNATTDWGQECQCVKVLIHNNNRAME